MASDEKRFNLNLKLTATDSADGSAVFDTEVQWSGVSYGGFCMIEKELIAALKRMNEFGEAQAGDWEESKKEKRG